MSYTRIDPSAEASPETGEVRQDAAATLGAVGAAVGPHKTGLGQKIAIAGTLYRLAKRYPLPTLLIGGAALALYMGRRNARARITRH